MDGRGMNRTVYASSMVAIQATDHPADVLLIAEAMAAGMPVETIAHVSGVPVENIRQLSAGG
jgi:hypothetical protein